MLSAVIPSIHSYPAAPLARRQVHQRRWPFHEGPPDHYDRLSSLLDLSVSQSGWLMPLHSNGRFPTDLSQPSHASVTL
jgi:hypothetical protein